MMWTLHEGLQMNTEALILSSELRDLKKKKKNIEKEQNDNKKQSDIFSGVHSLV